MIFSILVGAAIGWAIGTAIAEIFFTIYEYYSAARAHIKEKARQENSSISKLIVFVNEQDTCADEEELVIRAYDSSNNHIANLNVTAPSGSGIRVGDTMYV